ncbi:MAG: hypothetical protein IPP90_02195 [Gemmatimonadaceae bacterium]|nr:hypothetical protein [Gemmatimonadaceae bacterium]
MTTTAAKSVPIAIREFGTFLVVAIVLLSAPAAISLYLHDHVAFAVSIGAIMIAAALPFSSIQVLASDGRLRVKLGGFFTVRNVALTDIASIQRIRPPVLAGLGIRWLPQGTLYTVTLGDAVEFQLRDGSRFFVGSDTPDAMCTQLNTVITADAGH